MFYMQRVIGFDVLKKTKLRVEKLIGLLMRNFSFVRNNLGQSG